jgi:Nucleoside 2-deoxyribosyltransferase like
MNMLHYYKAPTPVPMKFGMAEYPTLFLAGTIDDGNSENWQDRAIGIIASEISGDFSVVNPRRDNWDPHLGESELRKQINWELDNIQRSHVVFMYLHPGSKSPISLLEMGLMIGQTSTGMALNRLVVCCPPGFWRKTNVEVVCERNSIHLYEDFDEALKVAIKLAYARAELP